VLANPGGRRKGDGKQRTIALPGTALCRLADDVEFLVSESQAGFRAGDGPSATTAGLFVPQTNAAFLRSIESRQRAAVRLSMVVASIGRGFWPLKLFRLG
jgi:hypothetical protein